MSNEVKPTSYRIPEKLKQKISDCAHDERISKQQFVIDAIEYYIAKIEQGKKLVANLPSAKDFI